MEVRADHSKKIGSTPSDAPIKTLMICTYCREKYFSDNENKDPETFFPSTKEFNKISFTPFFYKQSIFDPRPENC